MRRTTAFTFIGILLMGSGLAARQPSPAATAIERRAERPRGAAQNQWRYQYSDGRWWYWGPDERWSYFDGSRWRSFEQPTGYVRRPVDPALLRIEYKEGSLGYHRWPRVAGQGGGVGLPLSGTQGSLGGAPSGSFTDPGGVPSAMNTSIGTTTGVGGLSAGGRPVNGSPLNGGRSFILRAR